MVGFWLTSVSHFSLLFLRAIISRITLTVGGIVTSDLTKSIFVILTMIIGLFVIFVMSLEMLSYLHSYYERTKNDKYLLRVPKDGEKHP